MSEDNKIIIVGAGVAGRELIYEIRKYWDDYYNVIGFIDDDRKKVGKKIGTVKVLGTIASLKEILKNHQIKQIFIAIPSADGETIRKIVETCDGEKVIFKIVPRSLEIVRGRVKLEQIREIQVEDLLGRAIVRGEQPIFIKNFKDKKILVTGAAGSIGSELCRQLIQFNPSMLIAFDWWENGIFELGMELDELTTFNNYKGIIGNIQEYKKIRQTINDLKPDIIFHAAAFKHVPLMQLHPEEAVKNNIFGTLNLTRAAFEEKVKKFIYISSDKAADPINIMGTTKLIGERIIASFNKKGKTQYSAVRFGNVLGSHGSVVPVFKKQISRGGPVTVTNGNMLRYFMTIPEAVQLVLHASVLGRGGEIFILDMGEPLKIYDLAKFMIRLAGFIPEKDIEIKFTGTRPGEKMTEVLKAESEILEQTNNQKIFMVRQSYEGLKELMHLIAKLKKSLIKQNNSEIFHLLKEFTPTLKES